MLDQEHVALAEFLGGYRSLTRDAYALDLRQFVAFCGRCHLQLFEVRRSDIETFRRELEAKGRATATIARRLCTVTGFYRYVEEEALVAHSPAVHVRRPRIDYESHAIGLDRNDVGALLVAAGLGPATEHALVSLLALNGLRVSEAIGADIEALGVQRGHRTLTIVRKGCKTVTIPLAPRTARVVDLAVGERADGRSSSPGTDGASIITARPGSSDGSRSRSRSAPTPCVMPSSLRPWMPGCHSVTCRRSPPMPIRAQPCDTTEPGRPLTVTPPTSLPRTRRRRPLAIR